MSDDPGGLDADQLAAYFALMEVSSLLQHAVEQQLRADGGLSYVQFQILARLSDAPAGRLRMTDLADGVVYSRSGLTYQAGQLVAAGLVTREPTPGDDRGITVTISRRGAAVLADVLPGHVQLVRDVLLVPLSRTDVTALTRVLTRVRDRMRAGPPRSATPRSGSRVRG